MDGGGQFETSIKWLSNLSYFRFSECNYYQFSVACDYFEKVRGERWKSLKLPKRVHLLVITEKVRYNS